MKGKKKRRRQNKQTHFIQIRILKFSAFYVWNGAAWKGRREN